MVVFREIQHGILTVTWKWQYNFAKWLRTEVWNTCAAISYNEDLILRVPTILVTSFLQTLHWATFYCPLWYSWNVWTGSFKVSFRWIHICNFQDAYDRQVWISGVSVPLTQCGWLSTRSGSIGLQNCNSLLPFVCERGLLLLFLIRLWKISYSERKQEKYVRKIRTYENDARNCHVEVV